MTNKSKPNPSNKTPYDPEELQERKKRLALGVPLQWMTLMMFFYGAVSYHFNGALLAREVDVPPWVLNLFLIGNVLGALSHLYTEYVLFKANMSTMIRMRIQQGACVFAFFLAVLLFIV